MQPAQSEIRPIVLHALKDALAAGIAAFGLFVVMLGFRTEDTRTQIFLSARPTLLATAVAIVFVGRFLISLLYNLGTLRAISIGFGPVRNALAPIGEYIGPVLLGAAVLFPIIFYDNSYYLGIAIIVFTYIMLGWGLNIVVGLAGLLDLGYVAFYAVGAYSYAIIAIHFGWSFWVCLPLAGIFAAFFGVLLGFPVLRLRGDYLAIVTLAFGEIVHILLKNLVPLTGGPNGLTGIPRASFFGIPFDDTSSGFASMFGLNFDPTHRTVFLFYVILVLALITNFATIRLRGLPIGRAWEALREDEIACRSLGINTRNTKLTAFAIGAMFGGFAGSFFATRQGFISPDSFTFPESALIIAIVVLGGMGSQLGVAIAAAVMVGGFELFREFAQFRMVIFGLAMVGIMIWRPRGLVSSRDPTVYLKERKSIGAAHVAEGRG